MAKYKRILLKLSGEALLGDKSFGIDYRIMDQICADVKEVHEAGTDVVIVIGAGNIWRGSENSESGIDRVPSDYIGMMGTVMNSVALQAGLEKLGMETRICSALDIPAVAEPYIRRRAERHLEKGRIVICSAGTGNPYFTTDSAAALRSLELECDVLMKGTNTDGVYNDDPRTNPNAVRYEEVSFEEVLEKQLRVMDATAIAQCRDNKMPIVVFELLKKGNIARVVNGENVGTRIVL
ncbi:MAG TPA: UMP kinase [Candidatus Gracilibacteria bacterium]